MDASASMSVELDGPDVSPASVDAMAFLRLAEAWFRLVDRVAASDGAGLRLTGLEVVDKCALVRSRPADIERAKTLSKLSWAVVEEREDAPRGAEVAAKNVRQHLHALPAGYMAKVGAGDWCEALRVMSQPAAGDTTELTSLRVTVLRVGGKEPRARLESPSEDGPFVVDVEETLARELGALLYKRADLELRLHRDHDGEITGGRVLAVHPLRDGAEDWTRYLAAQGESWAIVDDVMGELGRRH